MSESDIVSACRDLGLRRPPTLPRPGASSGEPSTSDPPPMGPMPQRSPWLVDLLTTLAGPRVAVFVHHQLAARATELVVYAASPPWAFEQVAGADSTYRLRLLGFDDLMPAVLRACELTDRGPPDARAVTLSVRTLIDVLEHAADDDTKILRRLRADGVPARDAAPLVDAVRSAICSAQVTVAFLRSPTRLDGSTTGWLDGAGGGLWRVDVPRLSHSGDFGTYGEGLMDQVMATLVPTTRAELVEEIVNGFPVGCRPLSGGTD